MIIDTHTHIYLNKKTTEENIISQLKDDDITNIISIWIDLETSKKSIELARKNPWIIYATVWIHPNDIWKYKNNLKETIDKLEKMIVENREFVKWVWECWFDYHYTKDENFKEKSHYQEIFFREQIILAKKYNLPVVIHSRDSKDDTLRVLKELDCKKFILHCYSEDLDFAYKVIYYSSECKISFSWIVTYKSALNVQNTAANIPLDKILVETDCPFLAPQEVRWSENIPNNAKYNLKKVFNLRQENWKKETWEDFEKQVFQNSKNIFKI
jgi:TatD DNase family protein